jgi:Alpha/beta hydrolase of unknown function (DUF1400)
MFLRTFTNMTTWFLKGSWMTSLAIGLGLLLPVGEAIAAERVILKYRIFQASISVDELTTLAETGEVSPALSTHLELAQKDPEDLRQALNREVEVSPAFLDRALNSSLGNGVLDRLGEVIYPSSGEASRQALRSALVLSAEDDSQVSAIEVIQNYPTQEIYVNGDRIVAVYNQINAFQRRIADLLEDGLGNLW